MLLFIGDVVAREGVLVIRDWNFLVVSTFYELAHEPGVERNLAVQGLCRDLQFLAMCVADWEKVYRRAIC